MSFEKFLLRFRKEILASFFFLTILSLMVFLGKTIFSQKVQAQTATTTIGVAATVEAWLDFSVSTTSVNLLPPLVQADGTLNVGSSTDITLNVGTNAYNGWSVTIRGQNAGLLYGAIPHLIPTVAATGTVATGTEAYGANATSTLAGVIIGAYYDYYGTNVVGAIASSTSYTLASKGTSNSTQSVANMVVKASATATTPPGNYTDTITLTATANL